MCSCAVLMRTVFLKGWGINETEGTVWQNKQKSGVKDWKFSVEEDFNSSD